MRNDNKFQFDCSLAGNVFKMDDGVNLACNVKTDAGNNLGDFNITYKNINGEKKVKFDVGKDLLLNVVTESINIDRLIDKFGTLFA